MALWLVLVYASKQMLNDSYYMDAFMTSSLRYNMCYLYSVQHFRGEGWRDKEHSPCSKANMEDIDTVIRPCSAVLHGHPQFDVHLYYFYGECPGFGFTGACLYASLLPNNKSHCTLTTVLYMHKEDISTF